VVLEIRAIPYEANALDRSDIEPRKSVPENFETENCVASGCYLGPGSGANISRKRANTAFVIKRSSSSSPIANAKAKNTP